MRSHSYVGDFELMVLLAVLRLGDRAYGVPTSREIGQETGRDVVLGSVYATLERLENKGFVSSHLGEATAQQEEGPSDIFVSPQKAYARFGKPGRR